MYSNSYNRKHLEGELVESSERNSEVKRKYDKEYTEKDYKAAIEKSMIAITCGLVLSLLVFILFICILSRLTKSTT